ncbi:hypothetical protein LshimejAT787_1300640 [Lyophyllum shimeji]|uniref:Uncharacterized protein n=1 Tax=Lyophyllum shimeji TaxID=47721 RepID=A0A9P3PX17_LYOSH|nr:hypothetical protein LshimejAT787_1300600 [Lyophyllum shimeji]GLB43163.1 hypothetical protein LshimejAT787_1300640 [Lyophyllum shimeji]
MERRPRVPGAADTSGAHERPPQPTLGVNNSLPQRHALQRAHNPRNLKATAPTFDQAHRHLVVQRAPDYVSGTSSIPTASGSTTGDSDAHDDPEYHLRLPTTQPG